MPAQGLVHNPSICWDTIPQGRLLSDIVNGDDAVMMGRILMLMMTTMEMMMVVMMMTVGRVIIIRGLLHRDALIK